MKKILPIFCSLLLLCACSREDGTFENPPDSAKPIPLWFWNNARVEKAEIPAQLEMMRDGCGYGGAAILPFGKDFKPEYFSEEYFDLYGCALENAARLGMKLSLYDEYGFPSGGAGAKNADGVTRFKNLHPDLTIKRLDKVEVQVQGGDVVKMKISAEGKLMALVAMEEKTKERVNLIKNISNGELLWEAPRGNWRVMQFVCVPSGDAIMDYLSKDAARAYIKMVHDEYYRRFGKYFGGTIVSTFFDEPTLYRADGRSWTPTFNEEYFEKYGEDCALLYPALWYDIGEDTAAARGALFSFRSDLYAQAYAKLVSEWSAEHGVMATGHQDNEERENPVGTSGDLMKCFKYQEIPGIDKIGGNRPAEDYCKVVSSAAANYDRRYVMSETYGAMGNIGWNEIYSTAIDQYVKGVNMLIPHAVWYDDKHVTFKPELSVRNPIYADELPRFNKFLSRLNFLLQADARTVAEIAVLYPIDAMQAEHYFEGPLPFYEGGVKLEKSDYIPIGKIISNSLSRDFMYVHPEVLDAKCSVKNGKLKLENGVHHNEFSAIIVPSARAVSLKNLEKIYAFYKAGGIVAFTGLLPEKSAEFGKDAELRALVKKFFEKDESAKGRAHFIAEADAKNLYAILPHGSHYVVKNADTARPLKVMHRQKDGEDLFYVANTFSEKTSADIFMNSKGKFEILNPHDGSVFDAEGKTVKDNSGAEALKISVELPPASSLFIRSKR